MRNLRNNENLNNCAVSAARLNVLYGCPVIKSLLSEKPLNSSPLLKDYKHLFPVGVEVVSYGEVIKSDISRVRLYAGQDYCDNPNDLMYR